MILLLVGCWFVTQAEQEKRLDLDDDGVLWPDDCDGSDATATDVTAAYEDGDEDGYGEDGIAVFFCGPLPAGYAASRDDCDDDDVAIHPDAVEICDELDNNCDGQADEGLSETTWYIDEDGDGYGQSDDTVFGCGPRSGTSGTDGDCDDDRATVNPGALEDCGNGRDDDCDGSNEPCRLAGALSREGASTLFYGSGGFGSSLATAGDLDRDGVGDLLAADTSGRVSVFSGPPGVFVSSVQADARILLAAEGTADLSNGTFDADNYGDVAIVVGGSGWVFRGPLSGELTNDDSVAQVAAGAGGEIESVAFAELTGDSHADLLVGARLSDDPQGGGTVMLIHGPVSGEIDPTDDPDARLAIDASFSRPVIVGNVSGDAAIEWAVGGEAGGSSAIFLLDGAITTNGAVDAEDVATVRFTDDSLGAALVARAGDVDGDGKEDVLVAFPESGDEAGLVAVFWGGVFGSTNTTEDAAFRVFGSGGERIGETLAGGCDIDSDGYTDLLFGGHREIEGEDSGVVFGFYGGASGGEYASSEAAFTFEGTPGAEAWHVACLADVSGDGVDDFAIGAPGLPDVQEALVFFGQAW